MALAGAAALGQQVEKLPTPTIYPAPGTYSNTTSLSLADKEPGVEIRYTWDGSEPNATSALFDPQGTLFMAGLYDGNKGLKTGYTLRAVALKAGKVASDVATFSYSIERRDRTEYLSEEVAPGVRMIRDSDNDKMFLIRGTKAFALIDSGMGRGELRTYLSQYTQGLPLVAIWTHSHGDHIGQADQFIAGSTEYVGEGDREAVAEFLRRRGVSNEQLAAHLVSANDETKIDLGDRALEIITVPGHTPGSIVIFDPATGSLFTGDSVGNNSNLPPDVMWMQRSPQPLDQYFAAVRTARARLGNRVRLIMTGHNDRPLVGTAYLDNLERALQRAMDDGDAALVPSYRPAGLKQIVVGDRFTDPNWFGVNVNPQTFLPAPPDQIASLTLLELQGAALSDRFTSSRHEYSAQVHGRGAVSIAVWPASSRVRSITVDGRAVRPGVASRVAFNGTSKAVAIVVTAADGRTTGTYSLTLTAHAHSSDPLVAGFQSPPDSAHPRVWWHWMNGNVTWDGVQKDMDWMKRVGIAGLQSFDAGRTTPQVVEERLPYMSESWKRVFRETAAYADKLNLELGIAASPGWSETGGPWVTAADAMKKMVWSVTPVSGNGRPYPGVLAKPPGASGIFQTSTAGWALGGRAPGQNPPELYVDQKVIAFRVRDDAMLPPASVTSSGGMLNSAALSDGDIEKSAIDLPAGAEVGSVSWIQFDYGRPVTVRGLTLAMPLASRYYDALEPRRNGFVPTQFRFEASDDGRAWRDSGAQVQAGLPQRTISVDNLRARYFRFVSVRQPPDPPPRRQPRFSRPTPPPPDVIPINELILRGEASVHSFEDKAAFITNGNYYGLPSGTAGDAAPRASEVIDLTGKMRPDGHLDWTPPAGHWQVLRIGYSLTGAMNRPASPEGTGLEVDKLDAAAVKRYMDRYLSMYRDATGGLIGAHGLRAMMFDSWEASNENWTPNILADFVRLRGYDPTPWLPALAGYVIETPEKSDAFLWDWRRTLQQLLKVNHYDQLTATLRDVGIIRYGEAHEAIYATMGDGMEMKQSADIPMGAMWLVERPGEIEPVYFNDLQESASVAHIYGQNLTAAEALTGGARFGSAPWDLKPTADAIMLAGVNRFVIHTSAHQPISKGPGTTLGVGQYFTRNETWAEQAKPWVDYLSRSSYLLQQGRGASDVAVFYGEAGPVITAYREEYPNVPEGYRYDYVNADVILNKLSVRDGALVTDTGMRYGALFFGRRTEHVTLAVLEKTRALVEAGAVLIGERPQGSPSLADDPARVKAVLDALWPGTQVTHLGRGRVFADSATGPALQTIGLAPDFTYSGLQPDSHVVFIHRRLDDGDAYFLSNRLDRAETITASFRVTGHAPELWDPATGIMHPASYRMQADRTEVTVPLDRFGSVFVIFRAPTSQSVHAEPAPSWKTLSTLSGPWSVAFQAGRGAPANAPFAQLADFRDNADAGIRYFSGIATYTRELSLAARDLAGRRLWLDLGQVNDLAEVWVNGELAGTAWKPPYRVDISKQAKAGSNRIEIKSVNLWVNRLIGDVQPGTTTKITFTQADGKVAPGTPATEAANQLRMPYAADAPLRPSGLLGPVTILGEEKR
jgi:glyoxylase-like metal-dependent hydrolase (beta-lactamase superfamily II)